MRGIVHRRIPAKWTTIAFFGRQGGRIESQGPTIVGGYSETTTKGRSFLDNDDRPSNRKDLHLSILRFVPRYFVTSVQLYLLAAT